jgi:alpha-L-fucosidase
MKYGVLTTKHHDGFALWDTNQSTYDVASTTWYNTSGNQNYHRDIVQSYVNSFRNAGLGVGLYYSFWDKTNGIGPKYYSDDLGDPVKSSAAATAYVKAEISQLLTNYGHIDALWVDGWGWANTSIGCTYSYINYADVYNYIHTNWPNTLLINNVNEGNSSHTDIVDYETQFSGQLPPMGNTVPSEGNATLRTDNGWFYHDSGADSLKGANWVADQIVNLNSRNTTYLLDVPPNKAGLIPTSSVTRLQEIKTDVDNTPPVRAGNLSIGKTATESSNWGGYPANLAVDGFKSNFSHTATSDTTPWWTVDLGSTQSIGEVDLFNRMDGYDGRLRDITVEILAADGATVLYTSSLLNLHNILGGGVNDYANGPNRINLFTNDGYPVMGRYLRIRRTVETSGPGNTDDRRVLTLADVEVYAVRPGDLKWSGATGNIWDVNTTSNWYNTVALVSDKFLVSPSADFVTFSDTYHGVNAPTTTAVTLNSTVTPSSVVFDADILNYSISGTGGIVGGTSLVKSGSGTLTISIANSYTGGTMLNGGTLSISSDAALGAATGNLTINKSGAASAVLKTTATLTLANSRPLTIGTDGGAIEMSGSSNTLTVAPLSSTVITINGPLTVQGGGVLTLNLASSPIITAPQTLIIAEGTTPTTLNAGGTADPFTSGSIHMAVANDGILNITAGSKHVGALSGTGHTSLAASTQLTAMSIVQNTVTLGVGARITIAPIPGGPTAGTDSSTAVPEPSTWAMLMLAAMGLGMYWRCSR